MRFIGTTGLIIREYKIVNKNVPTSFYGFKVVHFSDLHYGMSVDENDLKKLVLNINETKPDIVIFTGDLVDKRKIEKTDFYNVLVEYLSKIESTYGKFYVSGNHDKELVSFDKIMTASGFISFDSDFEVISGNNGGDIFLSGVNLDSKDYSYLDDALKDNNYYKIFVMHYPDNMINIKKYKFDLVLAGHSHNGQVRIPFVGEVFKVDNAKKYYDPHYNIDGTDLFISGGIGNSGINLRLNNKPSFNLYRLVNK